MFSQCKNTAEPDLKFAIFFVLFSAFLLKVSYINEPWKKRGKKRVVFKLIEKIIKTKIRRFFSIAGNLFVVYVGVQKPTVSRDTCCPAFIFSG